MSDFAKKLNNSYADLIAPKKAELEKGTVSKHPSPKDYFLRHFLSQLSEILEKELGSPKSFWESSLDMKEPPPHVKSHLALGVFRAAGELGKSPADLANSILEALKKAHPKELSQVEIEGPFVNVTFDIAWLTAEVLNKILNLKDDYGSSNESEGRRMVIDYSHPNIAKPIGIGHVRSTIIGQALVNLYEATGWTVVKDNWLGDWGTQFGKLLVALERWGEGKKVEDYSTEELKNLYVKYHAEEDKDETLKEAAEKMSQKLEAGDEESVKIWEVLRQKSIDGFKDTYDRLGVTFDFYSGESYFVAVTDDVIDDCVEKKVCVADPKSKAVIVEESDELPSVILRKSDGVNLYIGRDLATIKRKVEEFSPQELLFVVGDEQSLHFKHLFSLSKKLGYAPDTGLIHINFGMVLADGKKMSTRKGSFVGLDELLDESIKRAQDLLKEKGHFDNDEERDEAAEKVGVGAVVYNDLRQTRTHNITMNWDKMLDMQGGSAAYLQYTYARIQSVTGKLKEVSKEKEHTALKEDSEISILLALARFPEIVSRAQREKAPHHLATYLENLAQHFNTFYGEVRILDTEDEKLKATRLALLKSVAQTIKNGLALLNIGVPDKL